MNELQPKDADGTGEEDGGTTLLKKPVVSSSDPVHEKALLEREGADEIKSVVEEDSVTSNYSGRVDAVKAQGTSEEAHVGSSEDSSSNMEASPESEGKKLRYKRCVVCQEECLVRIKRCKQCKGGCYCSGKCRENHKRDHKALCESIMKLEEIEAAKRVVNAFSVRELNQVKLKLKNSLVKLVGEKPMLNCVVGGVECSGLWDTGAMVSMVSASWLRNCGQDVEMMTVEEFLEGDSLHLCAANNTNVDVAGVATLNVRIGSSLEVPVPFLVTNDNLNSHIIGYNLIKHLVKLNIAELPELLKESIPSLSVS